MAWPGVAKRGTPVLSIPVARPAAARFAVRGRERGSAWAVGSSSRSSRSSAAGSSPAHGGARLWAAGWPRRGEPWRSYALRELRCARDGPTRALPGRVTSASRLGAGQEGRARGRASPVPVPERPAGPSAGGRMTAVAPRWHRGGCDGTAGHFVGCSARSARSAAVPPSALGPRPGGWKPCWKPGTETGRCRSSAAER